MTRDKEQYAVSSVAWAAFIFKSLKITPMMSWRRQAPDFKFISESSLFQSRVPEVQRRGRLPSREALNKDAIVGNVGSRVHKETKAGRT